jgi:hypothetical protein
MQEAAAGFRRRAAASRADGGMAWRRRSGGPIWAQMGPIDLALICLVSLVSDLTSSPDVSGLFSQHKALGASVSASRGIPGQQLRAWWWRPSSPPEVVGWLGVVLWISFLASASSWGDTTAGENRTSTSVKVGDGDVSDVVTLLKASLLQSVSSHLYRRRSDPRAAALVMVAVAHLLARLVAFLDHVVMLFAGGGDKGGARLGGSDLGLAQRSDSGGNPRSSDQSMVAFTVISFLEASVWSFFVVTDSCLSVRATPGETLNLGLPDWMTVAFSVALPLVGVVFGVDTGWRVSEAVRCSSTMSTTLGLGSVAQRGLGVG